MRACTVFTACTPGEFIALVALARFYEVGRLQLIVGEGTVSNRACACTDFANLCPNLRVEILYTNDTDYSFLVPITAKTSYAKKYSAEHVRSFNPDYVLIMRAMVETAEVLGTDVTDADVYLLDVMQPADALAQWDAAFPGRWFIVENSRVYDSNYAFIREPALFDGMTVGNYNPELRDHLSKFTVDFNERFFQHIIDRCIKDKHIKRGVPRDKELYTMQDFADAEVGKEVLEIQNYYEANMYTIVSKSPLVLALSIAYPELFSYVVRSGRYYVAKDEATDLFIELAQTFFHQLFL